MTLFKNSLCAWMILSASIAFAKNDGTSSVDNAESTFQKIENTFNYYSSAPSIEFKTQKKEKTVEFRKRVLTTLKANSQSVGRLGNNELFILGTSPNQESCLLKLSKALQSSGDQLMEYRLTVA